MKRALIFLHGNRPDEKRIKKFIQKTDFIIAADGGTEYVLEAGFVPDVALGDFDSLSEKFQKRLKELKVPLVKYPREKDETDSELAMQYAIKKGYREIVLFAVYGNRLDHVLANLTMLADMQREEFDIKIIEGDQEAYFVKDKLFLVGKVGEYVSLIPFQGDVAVSTKGLKWELKNSMLKYGKTRGISNEFTGDHVEIVVKNGVLLAIHTRE